MGDKPVKKILLKKNLFIKSCENLNDVPLKKHIDTISY